MNKNTISEKNVKNEKAFASKKMKTKSPKDGYDFEAKQKYRENVWADFEDNNYEDGDEKILFFPSTEGLEIPIALSNGYKQDDLIAVDSNPSAIATSKWRTEFPDIKFYGGQLSNVIPEMEKDGLKFCAANLDFCNNLSVEVIKEFNSFVLSDLIGSGCRISLTVMNGRESKIASTLADVLIANMDIGICKNYGDGQFGFDNKRLSVIAGGAIPKINTLDRYLAFEGEHSYMSGNIKMSYGFIDIRTRDAINRFIGYEGLGIDEITLLVNKAKNLKLFLEKYRPLEKSVPGDYVSRHVLINLSIIKHGIYWLPTHKDSEEFWCKKYGMTPSNLKRSELDAIFDKTFFKEFGEDLDIFCEKHKSCNSLVDVFIQDMSFCEALKQFDINRSSLTKWLRHHMPNDISTVDEFFRSLRQ